MEWSIEDGVIVGKHDGKEYILSARDIFSASDVISLDGNVYPFQIEGIRFSKLVSLKCHLNIKCVTDVITLEAVVIRKGKEYQVSKRNGTFVDNLIIDGVWYYLDSSITRISDILASVGVSSREPVQYFQYISIAQNLNKEGIDFCDEVKNAVEAIKTTPGTIKIEGFTGSLFRYQETGVRWLTYMAEGKCGCILADSMGLGKTLQVILTIGYLKEKKGELHTLVVAPLSLLENWRREIEKFFPSLSTFVQHGSNRRSYYKELLDYDVIITSYGSVQTDLSMMQMINWDFVILDEAQNIKNPYAKRTKAIKSIARNVAIAVTGTPFENHVTDIWSIVDFVLPDYLGSLSQFEKAFDDDLSSAERIEKLLSPIMIRRRVEEVARDLPERIDIPQPIRMTEEEAQFYDNGLKTMDDLMTLKIDKIQKLRMFCSHPAVYDDAYRDVDPCVISQKYERCCEIIEEIVANKEKAIIFTSFNKMIDLLVRDINARFNVPTLFINSSVAPKERQELIDTFSGIEGSAVMMLNPKAAGAGLNITAANHVIHYNLEWNPATEDQASARAYRRGQEKTVFIHRLYYINTIEEVINERIERKRTISDIAIVGNQGELDSKDLARALTLSPLERGII